LDHAFNISFAQANNLPTTSRVKRITRQRFEPSGNKIGERFEPRGNDILGIGNRRPRDISALPDSASLPNFNRRSRAEFHSSFHVLDEDPAAVRTYPGCQEFKQKAV